MESWDEMVSTAAFRFCVSQGFSLQKRHFLNWILKNIFHKLTQFWSQKWRVKKILSTSMDSRLSFLLILAISRSEQYRNHVISHLKVWWYFISSEVPRQGVHKWHPRTISRGLKHFFMGELGGVIFRKCSQQCSASIAKVAWPSSSQTTQKAACNITSWA